MRNNIPIKKNFMENGSRGVLRGSKPHSYIDIFSALGRLFLVSVEIVVRLWKILLL